MNRTEFSIITSTGKGHSLRIPIYRKGVLAAALTVILILFMSHGAAAQPDDGKWQFSITPYLWAPNIDGTLSFNIPSRAIASPNMGVGPNDYLENLDFALMISGEVRRINGPCSPISFTSTFRRRKPPSSRSISSAPVFSREGHLWKSVQDWTQEPNLL